MASIQRFANEILALVIAIVVIGITVGVGIMIQEQFQSVAIVKGNTTEYVTIPSDLTLAGKSSMIGMLVTIIIITAVVLIVFGGIIPELRKAGTATVAPT